METTQKQIPKYEIYYTTKEMFHQFHADDELSQSLYCDDEFSEKQLTKLGLSAFAKVGEHLGNLDVDANLEKIFAWYNMDSNPLGTKEGQQKIRKLGVSHTSMSVQDLVVFNNEIYVVKSMGFKNLGSVDKFN